MELEQRGPRTVGSLSQHFPSASGFLEFTVYSARIGPLVQADDDWSLNTRKHARKHALTNVRLFTSMSPVPGVRGMLGASQFVNVQRFHFSGPYAYLSAQPLPCSLLCNSNTMSFSSFCLCHVQVDFYAHAEGSTHHLEVMGRSADESWGTGGVR
jgi:hypothetical protein